MVKTYVYCKNRKVWYMFTRKFIIIIFNIVMRDIKCYHKNLSSNRNVSIAFCNCFLELMICALLTTTPLYVICKFNIFNNDTLHRFFGECKNQKIEKRFLTSHFTPLHNIIYKVRNYYINYFKPCIRYNICVHDIMR